MFESDQSVYGLLYWTAIRVRTLWPVRRNHIIVVVQKSRWNTRVSSPLKCAAIKSDLLFCSAIFNTYSVCQTGWEPYRRAQSFGSDAVNIFSGPWSLSNGRHFTKRVRVMGLLNFTRLTLKSLYVIINDKKLNLRLCDSTFYGYLVELSTITVCIDNNRIFCFELIFYDEHSTKTKNSIFTSKNIEIYQWWRSGCRISFYEYRISLGLPNKSWIGWSVFFFSGSDGFLWLILPPTGPFKLTRNHRCN